MIELCDKMLIIALIIAIPFWVFSGKIECFIIKYPTYRGSLIYGKIMGFGNMKGAKNQYISLRGMGQFSVVEYKWCNENHKTCILQSEDDFLGKSILLSVNKKRNMVMRAEKGKTKIEIRQQDVAIIPVAIYNGVRAITMLMQEKSGIIFIVSAVGIFLLLLPSWYHHMQNAWYKRYCYLVQHPDVGDNFDKQDEGGQHLSMRFAVLAGIFTLGGLFAIMVITELF